MKVTTTDGKLFTLMRENEADQAFIDSLDHHYSVHIQCMVRQQGSNEGVGLVVDRTSAQALRAKAASEALSAFGKLISLGLSEATDHLPRIATPADPQAQEKLAAGLVQLQVVMQPVGAQIGEQEFVGKEMMSAYSASVAPTGGAL